MMIFGYGVCSLGLGAVYYFMSAYFVVFLTNSVGISATVAGTISAVALMVEVVAGMIVGNISDKCSFKLGKRRTFMLASGVAMLPIMLFMLKTLKCGYSIKVLYYLLFAILFRMFFSCCEIPYNALGAEIVTDYNDRTRLRTIARVFSITGNGIGYILPLVILDMFASAEKGWNAIGVMLAIVSSLSLIVSVILTKEPKYEPVSSEKKNVLKEIIVNYIELFKLKTMRMLIIYKAAFSCAFSLCNVGTLYFLQYNLGLDNRYSSYIYVFTIVIFVISTPLVDKMAIAKSKSWQQMTTMALCAVVGILIYLFAADSVVACAVYIGLFALVQTGFWQLSHSMFYDIVEVDEYVNNKRREGDIVSFVSVLGTFITAAMIQAYGLFFNLAGFDPSLDVQPESVNVFLNVAFILVPCICLLVGVVALKVFPINKDTFDSLRKGLELRKEGKDYSHYMDDINKIIG